MSDLFYGCEDSNYGDDTTPYSCAIDVPTTVISKSQVNSKNIFTGW